MPPKDTIWPAAPHTLAKIEILSNYLIRYMQILGRSRRGQTLLYIDGFAGPDEYTNAPNGSPTAALSAVSEAISLAGSDWLAGSMQCVFIEERKDRYEHLRTRLAGFPSSPRIAVHSYNSTFVEGLRLVQQEVPVPFQTNSPLFVFIDPFGATGAPFQSVASILASPCSEVLINFDADGIGRIFQAQESVGHETLLNKIYGDDSWRHVLKTHYSLSRLCEEALALYKQKLRSLPNVKYAFPFEMRSDTDFLNYYLLFASQHPLGLEKMKEAMKKIDQDGSYRFSDASIGQTATFRFDDPMQFSPQLYNQFQGQQVLYAEIRDYTLNETPFSNPSKMLSVLDKQDLISNVDYTGGNYTGKRRKGDFAETKTISVTFSPHRTEVQHGFQF